MFDYVIIADDYTGAVEIAAKFMNGGYNAAVTLDPGSMGALRKYSAVALDMETFFLSPERAAQRVENVARDLLPWKESAAFFKRIEPGLRGNVGPELRAAADTLKFDCIVVASAFSRSRKAVEEGTLHLDRQEPMSPQTATTAHPASSAAVAKLLRESGMDPREVSREEIRTQRTAEVVAQNGCYCFDAENDEDLRLIVSGVLKARSVKDVLWVGSIGLANALATAPKSFIFVVGTAHPRSLRQARQLVDQGYVKTIPVSIAGLNGDLAEAMLPLTAELADPLLRCGQSILLVAQDEEGRFIRGHYPNEDVAGFLDLMANTTREIMGHARIGGLCVAGGDCAARIAQRARAENVALEREIQEGITLTTLVGGPFDGLPLITKSGSLGGESALVHCMEFFIHRSEGRSGLPWM